MMKYKIVKLAGASPEVIEEALNKRSKDGFYVEFVDNGWFIMSKWDPDEEIPLTRENENEYIVA